MESGTSSSCRAFHSFHFGRANAGEEGSSSLPPLQRLLCGGGGGGGVCGTSLSHCLRLSPTIGVDAVFLSPLSGIVSRGTMQKEDVRKAKRSQEFPHVFSRHTRDSFLPESILDERAVDCVSSDTVFRCFYGDWHCLKKLLFFLFFFFLHFKVGGTDFCSEKCLASTKLRCLYK